MVGEVALAFAVAVAVAREEPGPRCVALATTVYLAAPMAV